MLVWNYGLFWLRSEVEWGSRGSGNQGKLLGWTGKRNSPPADFRRQRGIYVLYDDNFKVIYIGQTGAGNNRLFKRLRRHRFDHLAQRWSRFSWFGLTPIKDGVLDDDYEPVAPAVSDILNHIEAILIAAAEPPLNLQRGRFGADVGRYIQYIPRQGDDAEDDDA